MPEVAEYSKQITQKMSAVLEDHLKKRDYLLGNHFSAVDIILASLVSFAGRLKLIENFPTLQAYAKRASDRPAFQRAIKD
jgi:glutathione S-transferase